MALTLERRSAPRISPEAAGTSVLIMDTVEKWMMPAKLLNVSTDGGLISPGIIPGLDASKICFEITETAAVASFSQANRFIQALKELGCKFALDDFGTGLSSFGYLKHFPVDFLKIDGSFVREILRDPIDREMVRSINEIGHLTGKQTIAEFAENAEIIQMLTSLGVDYAQGYGIAQPQRVLKSAVA